jgi:hypothetical protein
MRGPFDRFASALAVGAVLSAATAAPAGAVTTPSEHMRITRVTLSTGMVRAEVDGPRCRTRRTICRRYSSDARTIRCLERFGCFTGPGDLFQAE